MGKVNRRLLRHGVVRVGLLAALLTGVVLMVLVGSSGAGAPPVIAYVVNGDSGDVTPITVATNTAGAPIPVGYAGDVAVTPDGKTAYVTGNGTVTPITVATNTAGTPITVEAAGGIAITPDGKTAYITGNTVNGNVITGMVTPITVATNTAGNPITFGAGVSAGGIAITPDGKTAYVTNYPANTMTPIDLATGTAGIPITVGKSGPDPSDQGAFDLAITPDGKTAYITMYGNLPDAPQGSAVVPLTVATNTVGAPIRVGPGPSGIAITPDGATAYVVDFDNSTVTPITVATNTPGPPIPVGAGPSDIAITPDGKTAYVTNSGYRDFYPSRVGHTVTPIDLTTTPPTPGAPITVGTAPRRIAITPAATSAPGAGGGAGGGGGGGSAAIGITLSPKAQTVPSGGTAGFTITVTNMGTAYLFAAGVAAAGNCARTSGDIPDLGFFAPAVTETYNCTVAGVNASFTNTAIATAQDANASKISATDSGQVTVAAPITPPPGKPTTTGFVPPAVITVSALGTVHLGSKRPRLRIHLTVPAATTLELALLDARNRRVARWSVRGKTGGHDLALLLPPGARHAGHDHLRITELGNAIGKSLPVTIST
jgi:DNA-binding beta-propeller fold protein YncE